MARPYSMDLRERALARVQAGGSVRVVARALSISPSSVVKWSQRFRATGSAAAGKRGGHRPRLLVGAHAAFLRERIVRGDFTLRRLVAELSGHGLKVDYRTVWAFVRGEGLGFKKTVLHIARKRARWKAYQRQIDPKRLVFIDETWAKTNMAPLRGWGLRGKRLKAKAPYGHWKTMTFLAALRHDRIDAPWVVDGPINGELFHLYVEKVLIPTLKPDDIVILDNLGSHKSKAAIRAAGARLFFPPPYSPDLNPIEQVFAKLKHLLRKAAERTLDATWKRIGALLDCFLPDECQAYLANAGYGST
jgi:transposase